MDNQIEDLVQELRIAIRQSLKTEQIRTAIGALLRTGHEVAIAIDATLYEVPGDCNADSSELSDNTLELTKSDEALLQGMRISC